jgi:hypothetical protein
MPRLADPPHYEAKSIRDVSKYKAGWKIYLKASPSISDADKIRFAATYLKGSARDVWQRNETPIDTFADYMLWCRALVRDPANRMAYVLQ